MLPLVTLPRSAVSRLEMAFKVELLPAPLGKSSATILPSGTASDTPLRTRITWSEMTSMLLMLSAVLMLAPVPTEKWRAGVSAPRVYCCMQAGVIPFSLAYLAAEALNKGRIRFLLPSIQSDTSSHLLPSHCWFLILPEPSWFSQEVLISGSSPVAPSCCKRALVMFRFSRPQRICSPLMTLPLPNLPCAVRTASIVAKAPDTPRLYSAEPILPLSCILPLPAP